MRVQIPRLSDNAWKWFLLLPAIIIVLLLLAAPTLWTLYAAFTDMHLYRPPHIETDFVDLRTLRN